MLIKKKKKIVWGMLMIMLMFNFLSGCASIEKAIEHREIQVGVKMSETIFLDPATLLKNRTAYLRVSNTSDMQEIDFEGLLRNKLTQKGIILTNDPSKAGYLIQVNVLYMDYEKEGLTDAGMVTGGFGGALAGSTIGRDLTGAVAAAGAVGLIGSIVGGLAGSLIHVDTFLGAIDVQIQEKVEGGVKGVMKADVKQGTGTTLQTEREVKSDFQVYRTRMAAKAKQTNIDKQEAARVISDKLATQIGALF